MLASRHCWFFVLALISSSAFAQSIPATTTTVPGLKTYAISGYESWSGWHNTSGGACNQFVSANNYVYLGHTDTHCSVKWCPTCGQGNFIYSTKHTCPDGSTGVTCPAYTCQTGYTLNGTMCDPVVPPCPADKPTQLADGTCVNACAAFGGVEELQYISLDPAVYDGSCESVGSQLCGFVFSRAVPNEGHVIAGAAALPGFGIYKVGTGQSCQVSKEPNTPPTPPDLPEKKPPCDSAEGVLTSTSGRVMCVPQGTPSARKPDVEQKERKETFPDGTEKLTVETKTRDPKTGAETVSTSSTSGGGQSGSAGTSNSTEESKKPDGVSDTGGGNGGDGEGDCEGDDCGDGDGKEFERPDGDLYEKGDRTISDAYNEFVSRMSNAALPTSMGHFFEVGAVAASCGGMSANIPVLDVVISLDEYLCGETAAMLMQIARIVIAAMTAWLAFRIAFQ